jgi:hypothetical protein
MEARNTEPMLFNGMKYVLSKLNNDNVESQKINLIAAFDEFM